MKITKFLLKACELSRLDNEKEICVFRKNCIIFKCFLFESPTSLSDPFTFNLELTSNVKIKIKDEITQYYCDNSEDE